MHRPLLILDVHNLAFRAFHSHRELSWQGKATGTLYGFLQSLSALKDRFLTDSIAFCFEGGQSERALLYPPYKAKRHSKERPPEEVEALRQMRVQLHQLRQEILPAVGFRNIYCERGLEADDLMAIVARRDAREKVMVTSDKDLYQCISPTVCCYAPGKDELLTDATFRSRYEIRPSQWAVVKAIAGCLSDEISGIPGVGEASALKFVQGRMPTSHLRHRRIVSPKGKAIVLRNRRLVTLPLRDVDLPPITDDEISRKAWDGVCRDLGFRSLLGRPPVASRAMGSLI